MTALTQSMTRRSFVKTVAGVAVTVNVIPVGLLRADESDAIVSISNSGQGWSGAPGKARYRIVLDRD